MAHDKRTGGEHKTSMAPWGVAAKNSSNLSCRPESFFWRKQVVERQLRLQSVPVNEVTDCEIVGAPGVGRREAVQGRLGSLQVRQLEDRFWGSLLCALHHLAGLHAAAKRIASHSNI